MSPAGIPPRKGAVQKTQWLSQTPVMSAGPKARAGLMHMLLTLPSSHISSGTMSPTDKGPTPAPPPAGTVDVIHRDVCVGGVDAAYPAL